MKTHIGEFQPTQARRPRVVTLGNFDGVHLGHVSLLQSARELADRLQVDLLAVTFDPHPLEILRPEQPFYRIGSLSDQLDLFKKQGVDEVLVQRFSREFSSQSVEHFIKAFLLETLNAKAVAVGYDFRFGLNRSGRIEDLQSASQEMGSFELTVVPPLCLQGGARPISSSWVREELERGDVEASQSLLGRPFSLSGVVAKGAQRGKKLGFPTANLRPGFRSPLKNGVYIGLAQLEERKWPAIANFGRAPTFGVSDAAPLLEVHLLDHDFGQSLYGEVLRFEFLKMLRSERKFDSIDQLREQIQRDVQATRNHFSGSTQKS